MPTDPLPLLASVLVCGLALVALLVAERRGSARGKWLSKPVASMGFIGVGLARLWQGDLDQPLLLLGLALCALGDALLIPKDKRAFLGGIGAFMSGHLVYAVVFAQRGLDSTALSLSAVPLLLAAALTGRWLWPVLSASQPRMRAPVLAYIHIISGMVWLGIGTWANQRNDGLLVGALLFYASDLLVARNRFVSPGFVNRLVGLPLYYAGQCWLAWCV